MAGGEPTQGGLAIGVDRENRNVWHTRYYGDILRTRQDGQVRREPRMCEKEMRRSPPMRPVIQEVEQFHDERQSQQDNHVS